ncbi:MAG: radical SAM protein [Ruminococcaceae bacterium]|nr:radical SAM protein [Oscillospiraceae bacterium]
MKRFRKIYVEVTNICNKNCSFCHGTRREKHHMSKEEFERVLNEVKPFSDYLYFHVMGEPLCHPHLTSFIEKGASEGFHVTVTTNGSLLHEKGESLINSPLYKVQISLHSFEEKEKVEELEKYLDNVISFTKKASQKGILITLRLWNKSQDNSLFISKLEKEFSTPWKRGRGDNFTLDKNVFLDFADSFVWPDRNMPDVNETLFCMGLRDQIAILSDGTVVPCCLDCEGDIPLGNVYKENLSDIISSKRAKKIYQGFSQRKPIEKLCKKCSYAKRFD